MPDDDTVFEQANLSSQQSGIDGVVTISTKVRELVPQVRYALRTGNAEPFLAISISEPPHILSSSLPEEIVERMAPDVFRWVSLNREALLDFWHLGDGWLDEDVAAFKAALKHI
ncbi:hypothetical protein GR183_21610 [Stappia sp. GBMRC 2046]|uniref:Uncharacterized protein n=1 Tax=Stappia sediminis TaxID=2692190 RepID=A0A7X3LYM6_9HYPH|nr:hypothetical protein [Stappia sediminis]MXN67510.1 hypothetical protein [Stappia sediminis]